MPAQSVNEARLS
uniref:Uncharacterized protein n=1 Tax=Rhizophora mucronata TaxID=61149 RepID=A0A2P2N257_RHIMU